MVESKTLHDEAGLTGAPTAPTCRGANSIGRDAHFGNAIGVWKKEIRAKKTPGGSNNGAFLEVPGSHSNAVRDEQALARILDQYARPVQPTVLFKGGICYIRSECEIQWEFAKAIEDERSDQKYVADRAKSKEPLELEMGGTSVE